MTLVVKSLFMSAFSCFRCFSYIGRNTQPGGQDLSIGAFCDDISTVEHEKDLIPLSDPSPLCVSSLRQLKLPGYGCGDVADDHPICPLRVFVVQQRAIFIHDVDWQQWLLKVTSLSRRNAQTQAMFFKKTTNAFVLLNHWSTCKACMWLITFCHLQSLLDRKTGIVVETGDMEQCRVKMRWSMSL